MTVNMRLALNWKEVDILLNLFEGIDPESVEDLQVMEGIKIRLERNYSRHKAVLLWEKRKDEIVADLTAGKIESITKPVTRQTPEEVADLLRENSERLGYKD